MVIKRGKSSKSQKKSGRDRIVKNIDDEDWNEFNRIKSEHNKQFPDNKVTTRSFFKLMNTYSPMIKSLMGLSPEDSAIQQLGVNTAISLAPLWAKNIGHNVERIRREHDLKELKQKYKGKPAIIIGAGGSLYDNASGTNHLELIAEYSEKFDGVIILADRVLKECIELGIGDYFTVVDGSEKIYQFFDNEVVNNYTNKTMNNNEIRAGYVRKWLSDDAYKDIKIMKAIMATSAHKKVIDAWKNEIYFFVPSIPQEILPNATSLMSDFTGGTTDINSGGNCGMLAWHVAAYMGCNEIALVGMDYSYKVNTPIENTQAYHMYVKKYGEENAHLAFEEGKHPFFKTQYRIDEIYKTFKDTALIWIPAFEERGICRTYNCTEGGAIHGKGINHAYLQEFLDAHCTKR